MINFLVHRFVKDKQTLKNAHFPIDKTLNEINISNIIFKI